MLLWPTRAIRILSKANFKLSSKRMSTSSSTIDTEEFNIVKEGKAQILFPKQETVFYNPIQQFNRDLSVTCIKAWDNLYGNRKTRKQPKENTEETVSNEPEQKKAKIDDLADSKGDSYIRILEALSATGLRAIRYAHEIPHVKQIVANDLLPAAVEFISRNIEFNNVGHLVTSNQGDANAVMHQHNVRGKRFHIIDLDPYGTAAPFLDAAVQAVEENGLLLVTCTDLAVLAGNSYPEKCYALYGGVNMAGHDATHESALRLLLHSIASSAAKYKRCIEPLLSLSIDYYVRVFVRVRTSPIEVKLLQSKSILTYYCSQCGAYHNQPLGRVVTKESTGNKKYMLSQGPPVDRRCRYCGGAYHVAGPMWAGALHNAEFCREVLRITRDETEGGVYGTKKRIEGMVTVASNELFDTTFYFSPNRLASILKLQVPPIKTVAAGLGSLGYRCSLTHAQPATLKTDAPWEAIWYVMIESDLEAKERLEERGTELLKETQPGYKIRANVGNWSSSETLGFPRDKLSFQPNSQSRSIERLRKLKIVRYQENPTKNWGPKSRPK